MPLYARIGDAATREALRASVEQIGELQAHVKQLTAENAELRMQVRQLATEAAGHQLLERCSTNADDCACMPLPGLTERMCG